MEIGPIPARGRVRLGHVVEAQRIDVAVSPDLAGPALLDRIGDLNRARLLPVIERVLDEYDRPSQRIRIDRLTLDLGRFGVDLSGIEERLADALRAALDAAIAAPGDGFGRQPLGMALVGMFEHYLLHGAWPYGAGLDPATTPAACLAQLIAAEPAALVAMLRRRGAADPLLRRLVRQMPEAQLRALLHRLEPAHAAYVIAYLDEVRASHEVAPVVPATPAELNETLWTIVLRDALRQEGLQANRKAFLRRLLSQLAAAGGAPLAALVLQLRRGMRRVRPGQARPGSLVTVLAELVTEDIGLLAEPLLIAELAELLGRGRAAARPGELGQLFALGLRTHRTALRWLLRRLAIEDAASLAQRMEGALPLQAALDLLLGDKGAALAPLARSARTIVSRAALLRRAAKEAGDGGEPEPATAPLEALARLLDDEGGDPGALSRALERARAGDAIALRRLLRDFAVADPVRLRKRIAAIMPAPALALLLLPPHLSAALVALAEAAPCGPREWDALLEVAGRASESELASSFERRARAALRRRRPRASESDRRDAERLSRFYSALNQAAALWSARAPFSRSERALALGRLLPALSGVPSGVLRQVLRAAGGRGAIPDLAALAPWQARRLALLLVPAGELRDRLRALLRTAGPTARAALIRSLVEEGEVPPAPPAAPGPSPLVSADARAALAATLRRLGVAALDRLIAALEAGAPPGQKVSRRGLSRWQVALELAMQPGREPWSDAAPVEGEAGDPGVALALLRARLGERATHPARVARALRGMAGRDLARLLAVLAPAGSNAGRAARLRLRGAPDREAALRALIAALVAGAGIGQAAPPAVQDRRPRGKLALAAMLRTRPLAAMRLVAGSAPEALSGSLPRLLAEPEAAALLFAALPRPERDAAIALGRLLTSRLGRAAIAPSKLARALAFAAGAREWRGGAAGFTAQWLDALMKLASLSEQAALARLLGGWTAPGQPPAVEEKAARLRTSLREPHKRAALVDGLGEGELVSVLARVAPGAAPALLHAAERIAAARREAGAGIDRAGLWRALLAAAARDAGEVAPLAELLLDGGEDVPAPPIRTRDRTEQLLRGSIEGARDAPLRAALDVRAHDRAPAPIAEEAEAKRAAADPGGIHIANAGLVLVSAYLPRLFRALDFLAPDPFGRQGWKAPELRDRAVHLLQWLVDCRCDAPEPQLALNKLLCGMHPSEPVGAGIAPTDAELAACNMLLASVLANWPPLRSSSPDALRETFLQREGRLAHGEDGWALDVERKVLDILIDQIPWGFSTILHPWMTELVSVRWE